MHHSNKTSENQKEFQFLKFVYEMIMSTYQDTEWNY